MSPRQIITLVLLFSSAIALNAWVAHHNDLAGCGERPVTLECQQHLL